jgi:O-antigen ligase
LLVALVPLGSQPSAALYVVLALVSAGFCALAPRAFAGGDESRATAFPADAAGTALLLALPVYVIVQLVAHMTLGLSNGPAYVVCQSALKLIGLALFYVVARTACADARAFRVLLASLAFIGAAEAAYGILNLLAGNEMLLIWKRWIFFDSATGTLSSRNHFAFVMELLLPVAIAFAVISGRASRDRVADPGELKARMALVASLAVICALGLLLSQSRMGLLSFGLASAAVYSLNRVVRPSRREPAGREARGLPALAISLAVLVAGLGAAVGLDSVLERFLRVDNDFVTGRLPIWRAAMAMFVEHPIVGTGWGTFQALLPAYRPEPNGFYYTHAHNDYLEVLAEGGIVGFAVVAALIFVFARRLTALLASPLSRTQRTVACCLGLSITSVLIHSLADYGLRVPGVAFTFIAVLALFTRLAETPSLSTGRLRSRPREGRGS